MSLFTTRIINVGSENGNQQTITSTRGDWATPDDCPSSDRHCMCGQSRCPTGELEVLECYCMGPALCGLVSLARPSSRVPPLQTAAPHFRCAVLVTQHRMRASLKIHHMTDLILEGRCQRWQRLFQNMRVQLFPAFVPQSSIGSTTRTPSFICSANVQHTENATDHAGKRGHLPSR